MQSPTIIFNHIDKTVVTVPPGHKKLAELVDAQRRQVATAGRPPKRNR